MPIIKITQKMISQLHQPDAGLHIAKFVSVEERPTSDKKAILYVLEFEIIKSKVGPENIGRVAYTRVSSNGEKYFIPIAAALNDISIEAVQTGDIDTDKLLGKECGIEIEDRVYNGKITKDIKNFIGLSSIEPPF